jgi:hypothetical protein
MEMDVDTFLVAVYCIVDDLYRERYAPHKPRRPGAKPELSDSEVLTLVILEQWRTDRSESAFVQWVQDHWRTYFPRMLSQSAFNRRARDLWGVLCLLGPEVSRQLQAFLQAYPGYEVFDAVPVPLMRRCRGQRHRLFGHEAQVGRGGSDREWYSGVSLLEVVSPDGSITGFVLGPANTEGRWLADALFRWRADPTAPCPTAAELEQILGKTRLKGGRRGPTGPIEPRLGVGTPGDQLYLGDGGFRGWYWHFHWRVDYGALVVTHADEELVPASGQEPALRHVYASPRQVIETVHSLLDRVFGLAFPRARSYRGLITRIAAKVAALNVALTINYHFGRPAFSIFNPLD